MKLSEDLKQCDASGDFCKSLEGYAERAAQLEKRLAYASNLISAMGNEIIEWTPSHKKTQAAKDLAGHLDIVDGRLKLYTA